MEVKINSRGAWSRLHLSFALNTVPSIFHICICELQDELEAPFGPHAKDNWREA